MPGLLRPGLPLGAPGPLVPPPGRRRYLWPWLLLLLLLVGWLVWPRHDHKANAAPPSKTINGWTLAGARGPDCLRLDLAVDDSGSMLNFSSARDAALSQLVAWLPGNLRPDDEVAVIDFAGVASVRNPPTRVGQLTQRPAVDVSGGSARGTLLDPVFDSVSGLPPTRCQSALVLMSDAQLDDLPANAAAGRRLLLDHSTHAVRLLVPGRAIVVPPEWTTAFPEAPPARFDGYDGSATALAFGRTIADLTGQNLVPKRVAATPTPRATP